MKWIKASLVAAAVLGAAGAAQAAGVGLRVGTTGVGGDVGFSLMPTLSARLGYSGLSYSRDIDVTDVEYDGKLRLSNLNALLDFSPLPGPFRITGGFIFNDNKVDVTGRPTNGTYTLNGHVYPAAAIGSLSGTVKSGNRAAPYLGIGYGNVAGFGVNFYFDLGVMFQGTPSASLSATCGSGVPANLCSQVQRDVASEQSKLQNEISGFKYYPVANIGVTIGF
ncbi:MAG TPA: hypothetical protein VFN64_10205 [Burkholderiaceae bacterium]|nr:hypothetical protein [Burkholderiaceae bacterium]